jgi:multiple sugar transport system ATP-binding protein
MTLADRVVVLRDGAIEQVGTPLELYDRPANQFVAQFIGTPRMNIVPLADLPRAPLAGALPANGFIGIRPEYVEVGPLSSADAYPAIVDVVEALGAETLIYSTLENGLQIVARRNERSDINPGDRVSLMLNQQHMHVFDPAGKVVAAPQPAAH